LESKVIKLKLNEATDAYQILQGKTDKVLDSLIAQMGKEDHISFHIPNKGRYRIQTFKDQVEPYTKYFNYMIVKYEKSTSAQK